MAIGYDCYRSLWNKLEKRYWKYQIKIYYVHFRPLYRPCLPSYYARRYCHLITLVTSVYRKTNVFLTTVGTAMPPGGKMGEWSPLICSSDKCIQYSRTASVTGELQSQVPVTWLSLHFWWKMTFNPSLKIRRFTINIYAWNQLKYTEDVYG